VIDKENSIEFPLDSIYYLYNRSNPNPVLSPAHLYESLLLLAYLLILQIKEKEKKKKNNIQNKIKEKKKKKNNDLVNLPSHDKE